MILLSIFFWQHCTREKSIRLRILFEFTRTVSFLTPVVYFFPVELPLHLQLQQKRPQSKGITDRINLYLAFSPSLIDQVLVRLTLQNFKDFNSINLQDFRSLFRKSRNPQFISQLETLSLLASHKLQLVFADVCYLSFNTFLSFKFDV